MSEPVILINPFKVPEGKLQESIQYWEAHRDFMAQQPGYISTRLHQSLQADATFQLVNVAVWESQNAFYLAAQKMRQSLGTKGVEGLSGDPALYQVIRD
ncbi:antibiotic biosynthesis monooxygenase [Shewanella sp. AS16]|uniref:antibiotic biosynthesis monooxygenase family protein n=1 Tax=Shewanella sp. AS16 TaxID=2907625 RepID=UPI001F217D9F|nr:antibiotic biosynthesis monooxygenase family protein [Shewanella sp. AS16]MCE9685470.1 antibiotic biosynthesis monooxygenase [Shewanella sp. AS16]